MELRRLGRAVADRWVVILAVALLGAVAGWTFTWLANQSLDPTFEATAGLRFDPVEGETIADLADDIAEAQDIALVAASEFMQTHPDALIVSDLANARLSFITQGPTPEQAVEEAEEFRQTFLNIDPTLGGPVDELLQGYEQEAALLQDQMDDLEQVLTPEQQDLLEQHDRLDATVDELEARLVNLVVQEAAAVTTEEREAVIAEREATNRALDSLRAQKDGLPPRPSTELSTQDSLLLRALQRRLDAITLEYERLYLRKLGVAGDATAEPVTLADLTPSPADPVVNSTLGFVSGLLVAVFAVIALARTRKTVWLAEDLPVPFLGDVPGRALSSDPTETWYDDADAGPRKHAIQALRSTVQAQIDLGGASLALTGRNVDAEGVQALAIDLASSMASAGDTVLLIDANFESKSAIGRYNAGGTSLSGVLKLEPNAPEFEAAIEHSVDAAYYIRPGLAVVPSGPTPSSVADALAGRQFRSLVKSAQRRFDVVLMVVDDIGSPSAQVAMQRVHHGILVMTPGSVTQPEVNGVVYDAERLRISMLGAAFLTKQERLTSIFGTKRSKRRVVSRPVPAAEPPSAPSPISRLQNYPIPEERRSATMAHSSLTNLASRIGAADGYGDAELGDELLAALTASTTERAYEAVGGYLLSRTEDMVTARYGFGDLSEDLIEDVMEHGFMTLRPIEAHRTVASWVKQEIQDEVGGGPSSRIIEEVERVLAHGANTDVGIDDWLHDNFFAWHLENNGAEPEIWHLSSANGRVSILVPARRFDASLVEHLIAEVAGSEIDTLERNRKAAITRGDIEQAELYELRIDEVREFKSSLNALLHGDGSKGENGSASAWSLDWSAGTRLNLAPLQRLGLLPFEVLSEEEMSSLKAPA